MSKVVTICGSMKFQEQMKSIAKKLEAEENYTVIQCEYFEKDSLPTTEEIKALNERHYRKIDISDAIFVVNVGGYIGEATENEIDYARSKGKEVLYLKPIKNDKFNIISSDLLTLKLIDFYDVNEPEIPFYWYDIILNATNEKIGKISIRIGHNYHSYFNGNIGYEIDKAFRGNHYAFEACKLVIPIAHEYNMAYLYLTCEESNVASYKTIEKLGAELQEITEPPTDYFGYYEGMGLYRIYRYKIQ